jgi:threonine aldolase
MSAELLGKEAAIYMPSGSMTNQVAVRLHCQPGDEFLCEEGCHIYNYEQGAFAQLSGIVARTIIGERGILTKSQLEDKLRPENDHLLRTRLVCLENTHNRAGGVIQPFDEVKAICDWAKSEGVLRHLDGARLFNAVAATGTSAEQWSANFDSVSICFSKGLGAPVGSCLAGPKDFIKRARRTRKLFGGGMRQAGIIAAGAVYALENNLDRLSEDHTKAQLIGESIKGIEGLELGGGQVDSNIVIFYIDPSLATADEFAKQLEKHDVHMLALGRQMVRAVTHLDVTMEQVEAACKIIPQVAETFASRA